jgi:hypothetical protein
MIKDTIEFRMRRSDDEREPRKLVWNNRLTADHDTVMTVVTILTKLIERGVPDDEAVQRAFAMADKVFQSMLERGWAAMAPTLEERYDDRRVGFVDAPQ